MKLIVYIMVLFSSAVGYVLAQLVIDNVNQQNLTSVINAIFWFLIAFVTYTMAKRIKDDSKVKMISIGFLLTWGFCAIGVILGFITINLIRNGQINLDLNNLIDTFFFILPLALGPAATASLGVQE